MITQCELGVRVLRIGIEFITELNHSFIMRGFLREAVVVVLDFEVLFVEIS